MKAPTRKKKDTFASQDGNLTKPNNGKALKPGRKKSEHAKKTKQREGVPNKKKTPLRRKLFKQKEAHDQDNDLNDEVDEVDGDDDDEVDDDDDTPMGRSNRKIQDLFNGMSKKKNVQKKKWKKSKLTK